MEKLTTDQLNQIRTWLVERIFRDPDIMLSDSRFIEVYSDPGEHEEMDMAEVIASLYEVLHSEVTGEEYNYFFHHANKCGSLVEDDLFTKMIEGGGADGN